MLARHAEDLFWIGRYLERAEDTARSLDVTRETAIDLAARDDPLGPWRELLEILGLDKAPAVSDDSGDRNDSNDSNDARDGRDARDARDLATADIVDFLVADRSNPGSIASSVARARENARGVREWLTIEVWEAINAFHLELVARDLVADMRDHPYDTCQLVRRRTQGVIGVAIATMPRTEGFRFFTMGQLLERAGVTTRLLAVWYRRLAGMGGTAGFLEWSKVLKSVSAYEAYLREHRAEMDADRVLVHLLGSPEMPRSVLSCLRGVEHQLGEMAAGPYGQASLREAGRVRSQVEYVDPSTLRWPALGGFLASVEAGIASVGQQVESDFFGRVDLSLHSYQAF